MKPLISIITPSYNCAVYIAETIESVLKQTYSNWEMIITDDCSTDNSRDVIKGFTLQDQRIKLVVQNENQGAAMARNKSIELAQGEYIAFLDSDDLWSTDKLEKQLKFMQDKDVVFSYTSYEQIDEKGNKLNKKIKAPKKVGYNGVLLSCPIGNSTVMYNASKTGKFFVPNIRKRNDDALWLKMLKVIPYAHGLDEVLMYYRIRSNSLSRNKMELVKYHWYLYREIEKLSIPRSLFHICYWGFLKVFKLK